MDFQTRYAKLNENQRDAVEQIDDLSAVNRVTSQSVGVPSDNAAGFAILYAFQHIAKYRSSGRFGGLLFYQLVNNGQVLVFSIRSQLYELRLNAQNLLVLYVSRFSGVQNIFFTHNTPYNLNSRLGATNPSRLELSKTAIKAKNNSLLFGLVALPILPETARGG